MATSLEGNRLGPSYLMQEPGADMEIFQREIASLELLIADCKTAIIELELQQFTGGFLLGSYCIFQV